MEIIKRFTEWIGLKEKLDKSNHKPPFFKEREVWWCSFGENVGYEINGKEDLFSRPVVIYKKLSSYMFMGIPLTSKYKEGTWYTEISLGDMKNTAIISQARTLDYKRLLSKIGQLDELEMNKIKEKFNLLYK